MNIPAPPRTHHRFLLLAGLLLAVVTFLTTAGPPRAQAEVAVSKVKVVAISTSAVRVTLASLGPGWTYTLYASTDKDEVAYAHLKTAPYKVASTTPDLTLRGLPASRTVYWLRLQATRKSGHHTSDFFSVGLRPAAPGSMRATSTERNAVRLTWSGSAGRFEVQQATDLAFAAEVRTYSATLGAKALTPWGLTPGTRYYFRVRGQNGTSFGAYSAAVSTTTTVDTARVRAMTFNLLSLTADGSKASGSETVAPWSKRRVAAASAIVSASPDVVGLQEGGAYVGATVGARQIDSLVDALPSSYALAKTEIPPPQRGYYRIGSYIVYRPAALTPVGDGGSWDLGAAGDFHKWAVYQQFRERSTGTTFLFVSAHLVAGDSYDALRKVETTSLIGDARAYAAAHGGLPVVYAGDYNSHELHALDGQAVAMTAAGATDTHQVATTLTNARYNSSNLYERTPPAYGYAMDHVYVSSGVGVDGWGEVLDLDGTRFAGIIASDHNPVWTDLLVPA